MKTRFFVILSLGLIFASGVMAKQKSGKVEVVQRASLVKWHRVEVSAAAAFGLNEVLTRHYGIAATLKYHITPHWAVRAEYMKFFGKISSAAMDVEDQFNVYPEKRILDFYTGLGAEYTFFFGKFIAFNRVPFEWDMHVFLNLGLTRNTYNDYHFTPGFGAGFRFAILSFLTFNIDVGDYIYRESFLNGHEIMNNIQLMAGFSLFIPFKYKYKYPR